MLISTICRNPTPNKVKNIIKPSTAALSSLPIRGVDSTSSNSNPQRVLAPITPSNGSRSQGGKAVWSSPTAGFEVDSF